MTTLIINNNNDDDNDIKKTLTLWKLSSADRVTRTN